MRVAGERAEGQRNLCAIQDDLTVCPEPKMSLQSGREKNTLTTIPQNAALEI